MAGLISVRATYQEGAWAEDNTGLRRHARASKMIRAVILILLISCGGAVDDTHSLMSSACECSEVGCELIEVEERCGLLPKDDVSLCSYCLRHGIDADADCSIYHSEC